jgi:hypothetical protein
MGAKAHAVPPPAASGVLSPWTWFHTSGSRAELVVCLDRLRAKGWTISDENPQAGPFGTWDVLVRPPIR